LSPQPLSSSASALLLSASICSGLYASSCLLALHSPWAAAAVAGRLVPFGSAARGPAAPRCCCWGCADRCCCGCCLLARRAPAAGVADAASAGRAGKKGTHQRVGHILLCLLARPAVMHVSQPCQLCLPTSSSFPAPTFARVLLLLALGACCPAILLGQLASSRPLDATAVADCCCCCCWCCAAGCPLAC
jgi:hypothetical protein